MKKWGIWLAVAVLMIAVTAVYSGHFHNAFHIDDIHTIYNNAYIRDIHNIPLFFTDGRTSSALPTNQTYRPILTTTIALDYYVGNGIKDTLVYHLTSFLVFICIGICLFFLYRNILRWTSNDPYIDMIALLAVGWFMLHPVCAEAVNYIIQRGDLLAALFTLLALLLYMQPGIAHRYFLYLLPLVAAVLSKPIAIVFPLILASYILFFEKDGSNNKPSVRKYIPHIIIALAASIAVGGLVIEMTPDTYLPSGAEPWLYRFTQPYVLGFYFVEWFAPLWLAADHGTEVFSSPFAPLALLGYLFIATVVAAIIYTARRPVVRPIAFGLSWYLIANITTSLISLNEVATDHRMFFPFIGLSLAVTWAGYLGFRWTAKRYPFIHADRRVVIALVLIVLSCYACGAYIRNQAWLNEETLWADAVAKYPASIKAHLNYGLALMRRSALPEAERQFTQVLAINPAYSIANLDMGIIRHLQGRDDEAEPFLKSALEHGRESCPPCYYYYAMYLNQKGQLDKAIKLLYAQYELSDADVSCRELLMEFLYKAKRLDELQKTAASILQVSPDDAKANYYLKAIAPSDRSPQDIKTAENYINLSGQAYRTGNYQACIDYAQKALDLKPAFAPAYNNMGAAYNKLAKYKEAKTALTEALKLDSTSRFARYNLDIAEKGLRQIK